jgi:hypothetical protein
MVENILGTNVSSPIVPFTTADEFPTHDAKYGKGGFRAVATIEERDAITTYRKDPGMFVYVIATEKLYVYKNDTWVEWSSGGGGGSSISDVYEFDTAATTWTIEHHNLGLYPSVTTVNDSGEVIIGEVRYTSNNVIRIDFSEEVSGKAFIN